jgi:hypothetical protein
MALNERENELWLHAVKEVTWESEIDPVLQAAKDMRTVRAARYLLKGIPLSMDYDFDDLLVQVGSEYMISPEETLEALALAEERVTYEQT